MCVSKVREEGKKRRRREDEEGNKTGLSHLAVFHRAVDHRAGADERGDAGCAAHLRGKVEGHPVVLRLTKDVGSWGGEGGRRREGVVEKATHSER